MVEIFVGCRRVALLVAARMLLYVVISHRRGLRSRVLSIFISVFLNHQQGGRCRMSRGEIVEGVIWHRYLNGGPAKSAGPCCHGVISSSRGREIA